MIRQYHAQRCRGGHNPLGVGVIAVGSIFYVQDEDWWRDRYRGRPVCRNPWIVVAFLNGTIGAARRNRQTGFWESTYAARRSDMALVRSLRDGRERQVPVRTLILHEEHGLARQPNRYPTLPDTGLFHRRSGQETAFHPTHDRMLLSCPDAGRAEARPPPQCGRNAA